MMFNILGLHLHNLLFLRCTITSKIIYPILFLSIPFHDYEQLINAFVRIRACNVM